MLEKFGGGRRGGFIKSWFSVLRAELKQEIVSVVCIIDYIEDC